MPRSPFDDVKFAVGVVQNVFRRALERAILSSETPGVKTFKLLFPRVEDDSWLPTTGFIGLTIVVFED